MRLLLVSLSFFCFFHFCFSHSLTRFFPVVSLCHPLSNFPLCLTFTLPYSFLAVSHSHFHTLFLLSHIHISILFPLCLTFTLAYSFLAAPHTHFHTIFYLSFLLLLSYPAFFSILLCFSRAHLFVYILAYPCMSKLVCPCYVHTFRL